MPEVLDIKDPPIIVINRKYKLKSLDFIKVSPEFDKLLATLIIKSKLLFLRDKPSLENSLTQLTVQPM